MFAQRIILFVAVAALLSLVLPSKVDAGLVLTANLTNDQEVPPTFPTDIEGNPRPTSFGNATLFLDSSRTFLTYSITVFNIDITGLQSDDPNDDLTAAHFHRAPFGVNGPVIFGFFGLPFNDNDPNDVVITPFATGVGFTISGKWDLEEGNNTTLTAEIPNLLAGNTYLNFHTRQFPGGEIRGQITLVPEPSTAVLLGIGLGTMVLVNQGRRFRMRSG